MLKTLFKFVTDYRTLITVFPEYTARNVFRFNGRQMRDSPGPRWLRPALTNVKRFVRFLKKVFMLAD